MEEEPLVALWEDLLAAKFYCVAATSVFFYDFLLTLSDEVLFIWGTKKTFTSYLFLFNRYLYPVFYVLVNLSYLSGPFDAGVCDRLVVMQLVQSCLITVTAHIFMTFRVYALSGLNKYIFYGLTAFIVVEVIYDIVGLTIPANTGMSMSIPDDHHNGLQICTIRPLIPRFNMGWLYLQLSFDTLVFVMTLVFISWALKARNPSHLLQAVLRDGTFYFFYIFSTNLLSILFIEYVRPGLKSLTAEPNAILTSVMITRLALSLYQANYLDQGLPTSSSSSLSSPHSDAERRWSSSEPGLEHHRMSVLSSVCDL